MAGWESSQSVRRVCPKLFFALSSCSLCPSNAIGAHPVLLMCLRAGMKLELFHDVDRRDDGARRGVAG